MKYSVIAFACMLAVAAAQQYNSGAYVPERQVGLNRYNPFNRNNQYNNQYSNQYNNQYNRYQPYQKNAYRPFASTTVLPPRPSFVFSTAAPIKPVQVSTPAPAVAAPAVPAPAVAAPAVAAPAVTVAPSAAPVPVKPVVLSVAPVAPVIAAVPISSKYYSDAAGADIISYENEINPDGSFKYAFQTSNGIAAQEEGAPRNLYAGENSESAVVAQGSFAWISPEGQDVAISYIADENGYQPSGPAIPQPPPVPELIARALEYIARTVPASALSASSTK